MKTESHRQADETRTSPPSASAALALQRNTHRLSKIVGRALRLPIFILAITITGSLSAAEAQPARPTTTQKHSLIIIHPGDDEGKALPHTLIQSFNTKGEPAAYSMWVDSVICRDKTCDVVQVQLHWDALGHYQRFNLAIGSQLTKLDHVPFNQQDLMKLQGILKDSDSPLKEVEKESMTAKAPAKQAAGDTADPKVAAVSQPTILNLKTAVILGAGYTCYDLWHWSNGLLTEHIRNFSGKDCSQQQLLSYLASEDTDSTRFALKYARIRNITATAFITSAISRAQKGSPTLIPPTLAYLKQVAASQKAYDNAIVSIFSVTDSKKRLLILEYLMSSAQPPHQGFYDQLCVYLPDLQSYYEVHLFLNLMDKKNSLSSKVTKKAAGLLKHPKFFISRRAYAYLKEQKLSADLQQQVDAYFTKNKDRL